MLGVSQNATAKPDMSAGVCIHPILQLVSVRYAIAKMPWALQLKLSERDGKVTHSNDMTVRNPKTRQTTNA